MPQPSSKASAVALTLIVCSGWGLVTIMGLVVILGSR